MLARCLVQRMKYVIGQDRQNEIVVDEPSISSRHARLSIVSENEIYLEDMNSANGTLVNGTPAQGPTRLRLNEKIDLGACQLEFYRGGLPLQIQDLLPENCFRGHRFHDREAVVKGSTSSIFDSYDTTLCRNIAVKRLLPEAQLGEAALLRFIREAQLLAQLPHPNIPPMYDLGLDEEGRLFSVTRFVEGESLSSILQRLRDGDSAAIESFPLHRLLAIFQKACDAVAYAHARGVVHCALCPDNITAGNFGEVLVISWSFARTIPVAAEGATAEPIRLPEMKRLPTPPCLYYTPPEQACESWAEIDARSDIYALGAVLYEIITLEPPFQQADAESLLGQILEGRVTPPAALQRAPAPHLPGGKAPDGLSEITMRAMDLFRAKRYESVPQMQMDLAAWQHLSGAGADLGRLWKGVTGLLGRAAV